MTPQGSNTIPRPDLTETLYEYDVEAAMAGFRALELAPVVEVAEQSADFGRIPIEQLLQAPDTKRQSTGGYNRRTFTFDTLSYATQDNGLECVVDDRLQRMYRRYFDAEAEAARIVRHDVLAAQEQRICDLLSNTATFTNVAATAAWSSYSTAKPITDVTGRLLAVRAACGRIPNAVAMDWETYMHACQCDQVLDRIATTNPNQPKLVNEETLAKAFNVQKVVVFGAQKNSANPNANVSLGSRWTKTKVGVGVVAGGGPINPGVARTFHWSADGSNIGATMESYYQDTNRSNVVRARQDVQEKVIYTESWQLLTGVL